MIIVLYYDHVTTLIFFFLFVTESLAQAPVPELQSLDLKGILGSTEIPTPILEMRATVTDATKKASAIVVNTVHFLEQQTLIKVYYKSIKGKFYKSSSKNNQHWFM